MPENMDIFANIVGLKDTGPIQRQFVAESWLTSCDWPEIFPRFVGHLVAAGGSVPTAGAGRVEFGDGLVWTRLTGRDLFIRLLANDVLTFLGLQIMVEAYLRKISEHGPLDLRWHPEPFAALSSEALRKPENP
jgi:hypothetical protein